MIINQEPQPNEAKKKDFAKFTILLLILSLILVTTSLLINKYLYLTYAILIIIIIYTIHKLRVTKVKEKKKEFRSLLEKHKILLNNVETQIWYANDTDSYGMVNQAHADFLGVEKEELKDKNCITSNQEVFTTKEKITTKQWVKNYKGQKRLLSITKIPKLNTANEVEYVICTAEDITKEYKKEEKIKRLTFHDSLTGLYNRRYFEQELQRLDTQRQLPLSIIIGDVNGLKLANDAFGHHLGDKLLRKAAQTIKNSCRNEDIVARWGGDEFAILLPQTTEKDVKKVCSRIEKDCKEKDLGLIDISISLGHATKKLPTQSSKDIFKEAEDWMYKKKLKKSRKFHNKTISSLKETLKKKTHETLEHGQRIESLALKLGKKLNLAKPKLNNLSLLAKFHDLGKVAISKKILEKNKSLTEEEWGKIQEHTKIGYQIAKSSFELRHISQEILNHHEWWNGSGYPQGLKEEEIPLLARIIAIIDAYDVMIHGRTYQKPLSEQKVLKEIKKKAGIQFDPKLVEEFMKIISNNKKARERAD
ncbi:diguanylate cyclase (GGDEF) domain-containing protein [Halobacteroides halobius DSM 5150]|uniref:Diguanylate cyclase (GGDEF) domain-containing protein n=1 Tax=Halobacteroides halobius (strain ATCC 35273 / DSM 5150 / MD-1) TaxID=748449 RepID=L0KDK0_HALHC|nr:diguanylate cyclase [Halobacteroides halobius]AGB42449.1 diguanylate cyclase (GGDEF) domain-containing protein [Halobacteroides halobius DSM 5150]